MTPEKHVDDPKPTIEWGADVVKEFFDADDKSLGVFRGHITDIYGESDDEDGGDGTVLYHVLYEDGDSEDLNEVECRKVLV